MSGLNQADPAYIEAMTLYMSGKWKEAEKAFSGLLEQYPDNTFLILNMGQIFYGLGRLEDAVKMNLKAVELNPNLGVAHYRLGVCHFRAGKLMKALEAFKQVVESSSQSHAMARYFVGLISFFLGMDEEADESFGELRNISPESMIANFFRAQIKLRQHKHQEALELLQELAEQTPNFAEVQFMMGQAFYGLHQNPDAIRSFQKVLDINPDDDRAKTKLTLLTEIDW